MYTLLLVDDEEEVIDVMEAKIRWNGRNSAFRLPGMQTTDLKQWTCLKKCSRMLL